MADFLEILWKEAGPEGILTRQAAMDKYNEAGVPITWARLVSTNILFEKKVWMEPLPPGDKANIVLPLKSSEENLKELEISIVKILIDKINLMKEKFTLPVRLGEIQKEI